MIHTYINILVAFAGAVIFSRLMLPLILRIATRRNLYDAHDERKHHHGDVPRLGGVAFLPAMLLSLLLLAGVQYLEGNDPTTAMFGHDRRWLIFSLMAMCVIYGCGVADDIIGTRYRTKFTAQIVGGMLLIAGGMCIGNFYGVAGVGVIPFWLGAPFTLLMTVFIINAFNLIDGIDGLSAMLCQTAMIFYGVIFWVCGDSLGLLLAATIIGVLIPFLYFNVWGDYHRGTKLFMGDTGSMTLGLLCVILGLRVLSDCTGPNAPEANPAILALAPVMIPCFDVVRVYFVRVMNHRSPFLPDRNHIHHRLLDYGMTPHCALATLVVSAALLAAICIILSTYINVNAVLIIAAIIWCVSTALLNHAIKRKR